MTTSPTPTQRLAARVKQRRADLGLTQKDIDDMSEAGVQDIEAGRVKPRPVTIGKLERALRWKSGSVTAILNGGEPTPLPTEREGAADISSEDMAAVYAGRDRLSTHTRRVMEAALMAALDELRRQEHGGDNGAATGR